MERSSRRDSLNPDDDREPQAGAEATDDQESVDLLGYLLGALEPEEAAAVAARVEADPKLREKLDLIYASLPKDNLYWQQELPPPGLADRTLASLDALIASAPQPCVSAAAADTPPQAELATTVSRSWAFRSIDWISADRRNWRAAEWIVGLASVTIMACLVLQALVNSRAQARLVLCQDNLRSLGRALNDYASIHRGRLPQGEIGTPLGVAGAYAPLLAQQSLIDDADVICPSSELAASGTQFHIPKLYELNRLSETALAFAQATMGGDYGYTLGYRLDGVLQELRCEGSPFRVVMADLEEASGPRHAGRVINVLFDDGHLSPIHQNAPHLFDDAFFVNRVGEVAPGLDPDDSVIAPSGVGRGLPRVPSVLQ